MDSYPISLVIVFLVLVPYLFTLLITVYSLIKITYRHDKTNYKNISSKKKNLLIWRWIFLWINHEMIFWLTSRSYDQLRWLIVIVIISNNQFIMRNHHHKIIFYRNLQWFSTIKNHLTSLKWLILWLLYIFCLL